MKRFLLVVIICSAIACNNKKSEEITANTLSSNANSKSEIVVEMEGKIYTMKQQDLAPIHLNFEQDSLLYALYTDKDAVSVNFNLTHTNILKEGEAHYTLPDVNKGPIKVDLNFFNKERDSKNMNKRIIFRSGTITIKEITKTTLHMSFKGEGSGMMEYGKNFPISGEVNITY